MQEEGQQNGMSDTESINSSQTVSKVRKIFDPWDVQGDLLKFDRGQVSHRFPP